MKKLFFLILTAMLVPAVFAGYFDDRGLISGCKFFPLQLDATLVKGRRLTDESSHTFLAIGLLLLEQRSAVLSLAPAANTLQSNYGLQLNPLLMGVITDTNYGISLGFENYSKKCYGIQLGVINHIWAGRKVEELTDFQQVLGANIADTLYLGLINISNKIQIGLLNIGAGKTFFQLGLLNYNSNSYLPWLPLINFDMGRKTLTEN